MPDYHPRPADGKCQVCDVVPDKLICDYDHEQRFRGYLCRRCKLLLCYANDDPDRLQRLHALLIEEQEAQRHDA
jgi:hypothetical protein